MDINVEFHASQNWENEADMHERLRWMRQHDPVHWSEKDQCWIITKFEDVVAISKNQALFTSGDGVRVGLPVKLGLIDEPEPRHTQLRNLINRGFTPRMVKKLEEAFCEITTEAIDAVAKQNECDFVNSISVPLPLLLIAEMIGIRREDREIFHHWSDELIAADGNLGDPEIMARAGKAFRDYADYVKQIINDRREHPKDDLVSILANADDEGILGTFDATEAPGQNTAEDLETLNNELVKLLVLLLVAGNETTRNAITGGMQLLIEHPDQRKKLVEDPNLIPAAVEEMLRWVTPVRSFARTVTQDTELRGVPLRKGQQVLMMYTSANRDEEAFEGADRFRIDRNPQHVAFGIGNHFCLGANLARMEMRVAFRELLRRLPDMQYASGGPVFKPSALVRTCMEMRVRYTPEH